MKAESIRKLLKGVINELIEVHPSIKEEIINNSYISGGCIPSMIIDEFVNDYDLYLTNKESADKIFKYFSELRIDYKAKFHVNLITENSINLSDKIQIVIKYYGNPVEVTNKFDWEHIKSYYLCKDEKLIIVPDTYRLCIEKELVYTGSDYPLSSLLRTRKFIKKGWTVSAGTILHIVLDIIAKFDVYSRKKLMDFAGYIYFHEDEISDQNLVNDYERMYDQWIEDINTNPLKEPDTTFSIDTIIEQMNGVDPLTIQARLKKYTKQYLSINEIINLIDE